MSPIGNQSAETDNPKPWRAHSPLIPDLTFDAVILVPGIMGSVLEEAETGHTLWGLSGRALATAWRGDGPLEKLVVSEAERRGTADRVIASEILRLPVAMPILNGVEPYDLLRRAIEDVTLPGAVKDFPYDWRLSVEHNAALLADTARGHLRDCRRTIVERVRTADNDYPLSPRLVFVAHSMGGLVTASALRGDSKLAAETRAVITLGTPFHGSVLAVAMLAGRHRLPLLPHDRLRALAVSAPGLYDLLPIYRCLDVGTDVLALTSDQLSALGANHALAERALTVRRAMRDAAFTLPGHRPVVGVLQPTPASLTIDHGVVNHSPGSFHADHAGELMYDPATAIPVRTDRGGDGTVYRDAAALAGVSPSAYVPARHGALTRHKSALQHVRCVLTERDEHLGPPAGADDVGLSVPDQVDVGQPWSVSLHTDRSPAGLAVEVDNTEDDGRPTSLRVRRDDAAINGGRLRADHTFTVPGLYRITVDTGRGPGTEITELLIVTDLQR